MYETLIKQLTFEEGNAPDKPFRSLVAYKNVPVIYLKILKIYEIQ